MSASRTRWGGGLIAWRRRKGQPTKRRWSTTCLCQNAVLHEVSFYPTTTTVGGEDVFKNAGVVVMTNNKVPASKVYQTQDSSDSFLNKIFRFFGGGRQNDFMVGMEKGAVPAPVVLAPQQAATVTSGSALVEVQRVRQLFPETWLWFDITTDASGKIIKKVPPVPDSITTWMIRAVAVSKWPGKKRAVKGRSAASQRL